MTLKSVAVTIPIYKETPDQLELVSINQCFKILNKYPIILVVPESLNINFYENLFNNKFSIERFDNKYFDDLKAYNRLMLTSKFYKRFKQFKYILIHQPDAYVFRDELQYWCDAGYDYIGAPWFSDWNLSGPDSAFLGIGNGGFSLRNVKSHLRVLTGFSYIRPAATVIKKFIGQKIISASIKKMLLDLTIKNNTYSAFNDYSDNEDIFWGMVVTGKFKYFKVPSMKTASQFSMEVNAEMLYHMNNDQLPFGCHAWEKYETNFWNKFIPIE
ncbi:MAG: hypothetical protein JWQ57_4070 [Mucilaginibacter sp.]|nr:hypothetical protein [Mucilaginibacter sp.]